MTQGPRRRMTPKSKAPCSQCERRERTDVGMMMASEVATHTCMRTLSSTPMIRNSSYSTGTIMPPPPIPSSPARKPVTSPPATSARTSAAISLRGRPEIIGVDPKGKAAGTRNSRSRGTHIAIEARRKVTISKIVQGELPHQSGSEPRLGSRSGLLRKRSCRFEDLKPRARPHAFLRQKPSKLASARTAVEDACHMTRDSG